MSLNKYPPCTHPDGHQGETVNYIRRCRHCGYAVDIVGQLRDLNLMARNTLAGLGPNARLQLRLSDEVVFFTYLKAMFAKLSANKNPLHRRLAHTYFVAAVQQAAYVHVLDAIGDPSPDEWIES